MKRAPATAIAVIVIVSMLAMPLGTAVATAQSAPSGMVGVPSDQVGSDLPPNTPMGESAAELEEEGVYASSNAGTLNVIVTSPGRAKNKYSGGHLNGGGPVALVFGDDDIHEGREVAVDADTLEDILGYRAEVVHGAHESGDKWIQEVRYENGYAIFEVPKFSENTATFSGGIGLSGNEADDGSQYQYQLDSLDGINDFTINVTGDGNTAPGSYTTTANRSETQSVTVGGNSEPREANVTITGIEETNQRSVSGSGSDTLKIGGNRDSDVSFSMPTYEFAGSGKDTNDGGETSVSGTASKSYDNYNSDTLEWYAGAYGNEDTDFDISQETQVSYDLYIGETSGSASHIDGGSATGSGSTASADSSGTLDTSGWSSLYVKVDWSATADTKTFDDPGDAYGEFNVNSAQNADLTITQDTSQTVTNGDTVTLSPGEASISTDNDWSADWTETTATEDPSVTINGDTVISQSGVLASGQTISNATTALNSGDNTVEISSNNSKADWGLNWVEVTQTSDPVVEVNGYTTSYDGTLADGESTSLATNEGWIVNGTNNVTIHTSSPSSGPSSLVGFKYQHEAASASTSVDVEATSWRENVTASNTYPSDQTNAQVNISMNDRVAEISELEARYNGTSWEPVDSANYELSGNDLTVYLGEISADTKVEVRTVGHKVRAYDGGVTVVDPTVEGDHLDTKVEITNITDGGMFGLRVDGTELGDRLHYASEESWTGESAHAELTSSGTQILRAEDANVGSTMRVSTVPVAVSPESGAIEAEVQDGSEPTFSLRKGDTTGTDRVKVTYYDTISGERYVLWSENNGAEVDADRAESPVSFITDGASMTYRILQRDAGSSTRCAECQGPTGQENAFPLILSFVGIGGVLVGSTLVSRKFDIGGWLLPVTATSLTAVAIQVLSPGSPLLRVARLASQSDAVTIGAAAALLVGMWQLDERTSGKVPWYIRGVIGVLSVVWALETLSPGVILGGLRQGVESMGPLIVIVIVGGGAYLVREWIQARRAPDTVVEFQAGEQQ